MAWKIRNSRRDKTLLEREWGAYCGSESDYERNENVDSIELAIRHLRKDLLSRTSRNLLLGNSFEMLGSYAPVTFSHFCWAILFEILSTYHISSLLFFLAGSFSLINTKSFIMTWRIPFDFSMLSYAYDINMFAITANVKSASSCSFSDKALSRIPTTIRSRMSSSRKTPKLQCSARFY